MLLIAADLQNQRSTHLCRLFTAGEFSRKSNDRQNCWKNSRLRPANEHSSVKSWTEPPVYRLTGTFPSTQTCAYLDMTWTSSSLKGFLTVLQRTWSDRCPSRQQEVHRVLQRRTERLPNCSHLLLDSDNCSVLRDTQRLWTTPAFICFIVFFSHWRADFLPLYSTFSVCLCGCAMCTN